MKKLTTLLFLFSLILNSAAQDTVYVYLQNGMVRIDNLETDPQFIAPNHLTLRLDNDIFYLKDQQTKTNYTLGEYDEIFDEDTSGFASNEAFITYASAFTATSGIQDRSGALVTIDYGHYKVHTGDHYFICGFQTIADDDSTVFSFTTAENTFVHLQFLINSTSEAEFYIYEDANTSGGTATTPLNNNRNSTTASTSTVRLDPTTTTSGGTLIYSQSYGISGTGFFGTDMGGVTSRENEIILEDDTEYRFVIVSRDDGNIISFCGEWYE